MAILFLSSLNKSNLSFANDLPLKKPLAPHLDHSDKKFFDVSCESKRQVACAVQLDMGEHAINDHKDVEVQKFYKMNIKGS